MSTIPIGSTDKARTVQAVIIVDRATGEPASAGGGAGTSDTTEATQLLVKAALDTVNTNLGVIDGRVDGIEALLTTQAGYLDAVETKLDTINTSLNTTATELPKTPAMTATDMDAPIQINDTATGARVVKAAVTGQACRTHAWEFQVNGACDVTVKRGSTVVWGPKYFGSTGGGGTFLFRERPYFKTATNEALNIETSASVRLTATFETKTEA